MWFVFLLTLVLDDFHLHISPCNTPGLAILSMLEVIQEKYGQDKDILQYFDLLAGTSIGGVYALSCSQKEGNM